MPAQTLHRGAPVSFEALLCMSLFALVVGYLIATLNAIRNHRVVNVDNTDCGHSGEALCK